MNEIECDPEEIDTEALGSEVSDEEWRPLQAPAMAEPRRSCLPLTVLLAHDRAARFRAFAGYSGRRFLATRYGLAAPYGKPRKPLRSAQDSSSAG
jgi:hypothetical protein